MIKEVYGVTRCIVKDGLGFFDTKYENLTLETAMELTEIHNSQNTDPNTMYYLEMISNSGQKIPFGIKV